MAWCGAAAIPRRRCPGAHFDEKVNTRKFALVVPFSSCAPTLEQNMPTCFTARRAPEPGSEAAEAQALVAELVEKYDQAHLAAGWSAEQEEDQSRLDRQVLALHKSLPGGGLPGYIGRARELLRASREGTARLAGYAPSVPSGHALELGSDAFLGYEAEGAAAARGLGLVLVAGGLGERLGYSGAKLCLPPELLTGRTYLGLYAAHLLALQELSGPGAPPMPLVIMTSDDTHARTEALLAANDNFGLAAGQLHLLKQEKVPCLADGAATLAMSPADPFALLTKPHGTRRATRARAPAGRLCCCCLGAGLLAAACLPPPTGPASHRCRLRRAGHGDVHSLLHSSGLAATLAAAGCTHLAFFQDTNALVFNGLIASLGVSVKHQARRAASRRGLRRSVR